MDDLARSLTAAVEPLVANSVVFDRIDSTHRCARRLIDQVDGEGIPLHPTLIVAERQNDGTGRFERTWASPRGGLFLDYVWTLTDPSMVAVLPLLAAAALHRSMTALGLTDAAIKWPNDILIEGRKLAGILIHVRHGDRTTAAVGVGVNVAVAPDLPDGAGTTSVDDILGPGDTTRRIVDLAVGFLRSFLHGLEDPAPEIDHWRTNLVHSEGDFLEVATASGETVTGEFSGTDADGRLLLRTSSGLRSLTGGDIIGLPPPRENQT